MISRGVPSVPSVPSIHVGVQETGCRIGGRVLGVIDQDPVGTSGDRGQIIHSDCHGVARPEYCEPKFTDCYGPQEGSVPQAPHKGQPQTGERPPIGRLLPIVAANSSRPVGKTSTKARVAADSTSAPPFVAGLPPDPPHPDTVAAAVAATSLPSASVEAFLSGSRAMTGPARLAVLHWLWAPLGGLTGHEVVPAPRRASASPGPSNDDRVLTSFAETFASRNPRSFP